MKLVPIQNESELKKGEFYIRAPVNYQGIFWLEKIEVLGDPYSEVDVCTINGKNFEKEYRLISIKQNNHRHNMHIKDLIGHNGKYHLFPFSQETWDYLSTPVEVFDFLERRGNTTLSTEQRQNLKLRWGIFP